MASKATITATVGGAKVGKMPAKKSRMQARTENATYTVKSGDDIAKIATRFGMSVGKLKMLNQLKGNALKLGKVLVVTDHDGR